MLCGGPAGIASLRCRGNGTQELPDVLSIEKLNDLSSSLNSLPQLRVQLRQTASPFLLLLSTFPSPCKLCVFILFPYASHLTSCKQFCSRSLLPKQSSSGQFCSIQTRTKSLCAAFGLKRHSNRVSLTEMSCASSHCKRTSSPPALCLDPIMKPDLPSNRDEFADKREQIQHFPVQYFQEIESFQLGEETFSFLSFPL